MKKAIIAGAIIFVLLVALIIINKTSSPFDVWMKGQTREKSPFGEQVETIELKGEKAYNKKYFVLYDETAKGLYCSQVLGVKKMYICTPMELKTADIKPTDILEEVISISKSTEAVLAFIKTTNFFFVKTLDLRIAELGKACLQEGECDFKKSDMYVKYPFKTFERLHVTANYEIE